LGSAIGSSLIVLSTGSESFCVDADGVMNGVGADCDLLGSCLNSDFLGSSLASVFCTSATGAAGIGLEEEETACVSRSMTFGRAVLPLKYSEAVIAGSAELAGGKMLGPISVAQFRPKYTHSDWKLSAFRGTMKLSGSMDPPASLKPRAISFCDTSNARRGRRVIPRSTAISRTFY